MNDVRKPEILALDIASNTGFCSGRPGEKPTCGSIRLAPPGSPPPAIVSGLIKFLGRRLLAFPVNILVSERPIGVQGAFHGKSNAKSLELLLGLVLTAEGVAYSCGVSNPRRVAVATARKHFIGHGRLPGPEAKQAVFKRCQQLGYNPPDLDASDACCLWDYMAAQESPAFAAKTGDLFRGKRP